MTNSSLINDLKFRLEDLTSKSDDSLVLLFLNWFEDWFLKHEKNLEKENSQYFIFIQDFYSSLGFYEPDEDIRSESRSLFGREVLDKMIIKLKENLPSVPDHQSNNQNAKHHSFGS